jgi:sec-independent protein translocase protein TatB
MFNVGGPEVLVIFLVALIVLGPQQLPKAMRTMGSVMAEVRKVSNSFQAEMRQAMDSVVDTSATEKPRSATMGEATSGEPATSDGEEIVGRNPRQGDDDAGGEPGASSASDDEASRRSGIDPADRAAG